jgi:hypothetical protein
MESWTLRYFAQTNPKGPAQDDVPSLLRRVADSIAELGAVEVQDVVLHCEVGWPMVVSDGLLPRGGERYTRRAVGAKW